MSDEEDPCPICYSTISIPISVPICGHKFCFCCLKGACADKDDPLCPICRREVDTKIFEHPSLSGLKLTMVSEDTETSKSDDQDSESKDPSSNPKKYWLYAGVNGWWRYEPRDEEDINKAFDDGMPAVELSMCGHVYMLDFGKMEQCRKDNKNIKRKIKYATEAEFASMKVRGIAGMRCA